MEADRRLMTFLPPEMHAFVMAEAHRQREAGNERTNSSSIIRDALREKYPETREMLSYSERQEAALDRG